MSPNRNLKPNVVPVNRNSSANSRGSNNSANKVKKEENKKVEPKKEEAKKVEPTKPVPAASKTVDAFKESVKSE